jgi:hypothetical protein
MEGLTNIPEEPTASIFRVKVSILANRTLCKKNGVIGPGNRRIGQLESKGGKSLEQAGREYKTGDRSPDKGSAGGTVKIHNMGGPWWGTYQRSCEDLIEELEGGPEEGPTMVG